MKKSLLAFLFLFISIQCFSQERKPDTITKLNGESMEVLVSTVGDKEISFVYLNETVTNVINKNQVKEIKFASGRVQKFSEKIVINGEQDWEKVIVTTLESDVAGLVRKGEVRAKASGGSTFSNQANIDEKATMKLKKEAAAMGAHIILIQSQKTETGGYSGAGGMGTVPKSLKQGVAYSYQ
ncbi:hypothetical protein JAO76_12445 [Pontibacter sp. BT310]|uniref:Auto-transporter adhesin head GIN domain-containing protein n=1 Tax=Pontibacter populi TaxID=890055 RepID=A0ABS6XCY5_9BACT|nr:MULTISPECIES: hypothetical protein [Pontibacter]MBJ6119008.1 hypothetical protein [Pontibacter sp. BT310]MBR0571436.1 hypothetical protein [Microvirga sp. STS03]MBW3365862.1 hypothetical protein [Pontibacter populi]